MDERTEDTGPLTPVVFHVLLALSDGPLHGYAVMKAVEAESGQSMGPGTVYGSLRRLLEAGWVTEGDGDFDDARRSRSFALTKAGRQALRREATRITRLASLERVRGFVVEPDAS